MNKNFKEKSKKIGIIFSVFMMIVIYYEMKIFDLLIGIFKLECLNKKIAKVSLKSFMFITKDMDESILIDKMDDLGWKFINLYGRGYLFTKDGEEVVLVKKKHLRYNVYEIQCKNKL
ncbi:MAG: hypothetical protein ACQEQE_01550 [Bacillota bacterium]